MQSYSVILFYCSAIALVNFEQWNALEADIVCCVERIQGNNSSGQGMCKISNLTIQVGDYFGIVSRCLEACLMDPECSAYEYSLNATECSLVHENITDCFDYLVNTYAEQQQQQQLEPDISPHNV